MNRPLSEGRSRIEEKRALVQRRRVSLKAIYIASRWEVLLKLCDVADPHVEETGDQAAKKVEHQEAARYTVVISNLLSIGNLAKA